MKYRCLALQNQGLFPLCFPFISRLGYRVMRRNSLLASGRWKEFLIGMPVEMAVRPRRLDVVVAFASRRHHDRSFDCAGGESLCVVESMHLRVREREG